MKYSLAYVMPAFALAIGFAWAGTATITDAGARNVGSSAAYVATCEKEQLLPIGTLADLLAELQQGLTQKNWDNVKKQYQASLHEMRQYSIAKDQWLPFRITPEHCSDLGKALPVLKSAVRRNSK